VIESIEEIWIKAFQQRPRRALAFITNLNRERCEVWQRVSSALRPIAAKWAKS